jgi:NAD(P)-dependent dehydrogenase (short-subunit alcohol dehydrogenase family)
MDPEPAAASPGIMAQKVSNQMAPLPPAVREFAEIDDMSSTAREFPATQVWLITGSSCGLGRALGEVVLAAGHKLVTTGCHPAQLALWQRRYGDRVRAVALDVTDERAASDAVRTTIEAFGRLDVLVNNAGFGNLGSIEETPLADFRAQIETILFGVIVVTKAAIPVMREQGSGHIIQFSTIGARLGTPGGAAYAAAKWGIEGFSEVLAKEVAPLGINVTIIEPGRFRTDFAGSSTGIKGVQPGDPDKAARVVLQVVSMSEPPLRLLLGSDAVRVAEQSELARIDADMKWRELSLSTDFRP